MKNIKSISSLKIAALLITFLSLSSLASKAIAKDEKSQPKQNSETVWQDNFTKNDIAAQMDTMEKQMNKNLEDQREMMNKILAESRKNISQQTASSSTTSLALRQDDKSYFYDLKFSSFKKEDVMISVKDKILTMAAKHDQRQESKAKENKDVREQINSSANFYYSLTIPADAVLEPQITREDGKITVQFSKKITADSSKTKEKNKEKK